MDDKFFLVWNPNGMGPPRFRHPTFDSAKKEAIRLGNENPGKTFHVMENIGAAKTPAAVFTSVFPAQLNIADVNLGMVTAGAATGRAVVFESTPNPSVDDTWTQFGRHRGPTHIIADAEYILGVKSRDGDPAADTLERARAEVIRLRKWISRIDDCACRSGAMTYEQRHIIAWACRQALGHQPIPEGSHGLPGFDDAEEPPRVLKHGEYLQGDRVRFTHRSGVYDLGVGRLGTVVDNSLTSRNCTYVHWDEFGGRKEECWGPYTGSIEHETLPQFEVGDEVRTRSGDRGVIESMGATTASIMGSDGHGFTTHYSLLSLVCPVQRRGAK